VFGAIFSTLYIALFVAALGIILRGACYAVRGVVSKPREERMLGALFGVSSALTPFALGAAIGGIASGRVPPGSATGDTIESWLNPTSVLTGSLAIVTSAYLAAVWLTADAARAGRDDVAEAFRTRALGAGVVAGAVALTGLFVIRSDAEGIYDGLTSGAGLGAVLASLVAGSATLLSVARGRLEPARWSAAVAVAAVVAGWALAQQPQLLPGLTVDEAAAGDATLVTLLVSLALGAVILIPSLLLLFGMVVRGHFDAQPDELGSLEHAAPAPPAKGGTATEPDVGSGVAAAVCALVGVPLMLVFDSGAPLALGVVLLLAAVAAAASWLVPKVVP
jgi:cytochrome d ubiquinol oxidase subunit II